MEQDAALNCLPGCSLRCSLGLPMPSWVLTKVLARSHSELLQRSEVANTWYSPLTHCMHCFCCLLYTSVWLCLIAMANTFIAPSLTIALPPQVTADAILLFRCEGMFSCSHVKAVFTVWDEEDKCVMILNALLDHPPLSSLTLLFWKKESKKGIHWLVPQALRVALKFGMTISALDGRCSVSKCQRE